MYNSQAITSNTSLVPGPQLMSSKRTRTLSPSATPTPKAPRIISESSSSALTRPLLCTLPPTCNPPKNQPTQLLNSQDLERHYAKYHAHVCEEKGCGCVFPDARLLQLHQTECHDPLAAVRKDRGQKIFACHLTSCDRLFLTPKARRLHLIQAHGYPNEYFFAVTNKGVGGLLKKWGEGASMIRGEWKTRDGQTKNEGSSDSEDGDMFKEGIEAGTNIAETISQDPTSPSLTSQKSTAPGEDDMDALADSMTSLSLIPSSIRFGRGGKAGGFGPRGRGGHIPPQPFHTMPRGRGARGALGYNAPVRGVLPVRGRGAPRAGFALRARGRDIRGEGRGRGRGRG
ncbi:hypothetical protein NEOLEDRAFT_1065436 [Neolentinus lepideus HHB14362 ss-1]|uniref:C2H2-type domain-containing protein n=1 Tax=Neolentinus lepideus HHB14362 ss-1 TaxID=1314782 RepID=A0A165SLF8_9AGAM|nr:hypothetical protein NEOLEDRAFT_1065436 [Neolentinus lepideus HHB14362 ss-1]